MINNVNIKNFKSIVDLSIDLGSFNIFIGENGCGKSNILEAIAFGAAASADKLDYEFLGSRGIRVTNPELMFPAFAGRKQERYISVDFSVNNKTYDYQIINDSNNPKKWIDKSKEIGYKKMDEFFKTILFEENDNRKKEVLSQYDKLDDLLPVIELLKNYKDDPDIKDVFTTLIPSLLEKAFSNPEISDYKVYSPEQSSLRKFEESTQIYPLGIKGEGLFQYLKELSKSNQTKLSQIKDSLYLLDWYEGFELPENLLSNEYSLMIKDRFLNPDLKYFDQRSTNEGFLNLLFYSTLFISDGTPSFFAIDNIDASLNPKLCVELTRNLSDLSRNFNKQVILTTHNPAILDGLNLADDKQRLFVIRRNDEGHTKLTRVGYNPERKMKLSEIWTSGFIGGLPENF